MSTTRTIEEGKETARPKRLKIKTCEGRRVEVEVSELIRVFPQAKLEAQFYGEKVGQLRLLGDLREFLKTLRAALPPMGAKIVVRVEQWAQARRERLV